MELIDTMLIERIRKALIKRYDRDQQIQQMIEEIGAEAVSYTHLRECLVRICKSLSFSHYPIYLLLHWHAH